MVSEDKSPRYDRHGKLTFLAVGRGWVMCRRPSFDPFAMLQSEWDALAGNPEPERMDRPYVFIPFATVEPPKPDAARERESQRRQWADLMGRPTPDAAPPNPPPPATP